MPRMLLMYSMYFVVVTLLFQLLAKHSSASLPCKRFVNKHLYMYMHTKEIIRLFIIATPAHVVERVTCAVIAINVLLLKQQCCAPWDLNWCNYL